MPRRPSVCQRSPPPLRPSRWGWKFSMKLSRAAQPVVRSPCRMRSRSESIFGAMWWVTWPVVWLRPTRSSKEAEPSQTSFPSQRGPSSRSAHGGAGWGCCRPATRRRGLLYGRIKKIAHRRLVVRAMEEGVNDDADAGIESDGVGGKPSSGVIARMRLCPVPWIAMLTGLPGWPSAVSVRR